MAISHREKLAGFKAQLRLVMHPYPWKNMEGWIASVSPFFRTSMPEHWTDFERLSATPKWTQMPFMISGGGAWGDPVQSNVEEAGAIERRSNTEKAEKAKTNLLAWLDGLIDILPDEEAPAAVQDATSRVLEILDRFPAVLRVLSTRGRRRPALVMKDEYDVQYLMHSLLVANFRDVRPEEWTPSYAGGASRMDFLLKRDRLVVETKMVRSDHSDKTLGEELIIDKVKYAKHPDCDTLVCFVYDPERRLRSPEAIEHDLRSDGSPRVVVVVQS